MFRRRHERTGTPVTIHVDGEPVTARAGDTVAAALLAAGFDWTRQAPVSGTKRAPYCLIGHCHECLVTINGVPGRQACLSPVRDGMHIRRRAGGDGMP
jgi:predicted molibdopterin-dependent oxidoreductase YjgC